MPMNRVGRSILTDTAEIILVSTNYIEQRIRPDARLTAAAIERNRKARRKVSGGVPCVVMIVVPMEVPVDAASANVDHFRRDSDERAIIALAIVSHSAAMNAVSKFYFRYYPQAFEVRVFDGEVEAHDWLIAQLGGHPGASSGRVDHQ